MGHAPAGGAIDVADTLVDVARQLLRRLREGPPDAGPDWRDVVELRATPGQLALLRALGEREGCTMRELANRLAVAPSTTTAMVKRLVAHGYVERRRDEADWRTVRVRATAAGRKALAAHDAARRAALLARFEHLSRDEQDSIVAALPALRHLLAVEPCGDDQPEPGRPGRR